MLLASLELGPNQEESSIWSFKLPLEGFNSGDRLMLGVLSRGACGRDRGTSGAAVADAAGLQSSRRAAVRRLAASHAPGLTWPFVGHCPSRAAGMLLP